MFRVFIFIRIERIDGESSQLNYLVKCHELHIGRARLQIVVVHPWSGVPYPILILLDLHGWMQQQCVVYSAQRKCSVPSHSLTSMLLMYLQGQSIEFEWNHFNEKSLTVWLWTMCIVFWTKSILNQGNVRARESVLTIWVEPRACSWPTYNWDQLQWIESISRFHSQMVHSRMQIGMQSALVHQGLPRSPVL